MAERTLTADEQQALVSAFIDQMGVPLSADDCYSDHPHDIATKGSCDYCGAQR